MEYMIKKATMNEVDEISKIYKSLIGTPGCAWNEYYPTETEIVSDINNDSLYCMFNGLEVIAAAFAGKDEDLDSLPCWNKDIKNPYDLARIGVKREYQNKGLAAKMIEHIEKELKSKGVDGIHFTVSKTNPPALALYNKLGYKSCGETVMFNHDYFCYEKKI